MNRTRKQGGDVIGRSSFKHIVSIGYELETSSLSKLTLIDDGETQYLLNTDTARKDIEVFMSKEEVQFEDEEEEENYTLRQEELLRVDARNARRQVDPNISFLLTNDIASTRFTRRLNDLCDNSVEKDELYSFHPVSTETKAISDSQTQVWPIHFIHWAKEKDCSTFTDVEWVVTYYKPRQNNRDIIMDTFLNASQNLLDHLSDLEEIPGKLVVALYDEEDVVDHPKTRRLFHKPDTNLYYLQTHYSKKGQAEDRLTMDDVCTTIQMTFGAPAAHIFPVMREMIEDTVGAIDSVKEMSDNYGIVLNRLNECVDKLFESYNASARPEYRFVKQQKTRTLVAEIKNYVILILYKLYVYYNTYLQKTNKTETTYFKNSLYLNCRHTNQVLYVALKGSVAAYIDVHAPTIPRNKREAVVIDTIRKLVIQAPILNEFLVNDIKYVRKNAFSITNTLEKTAAGYGDPQKSLFSYFQFFEDPVTTDDNVALDDTIIYRDWLQYKGVDRYSSKMDIKDNIVLIEFRAFHLFLATYMYSVADAAMRKSMKEGICNQMTGYFKEDIPMVSIGNLRRFVEISKERKRADFSTAKSRRATHKKKIDA